MQPKMSPPAITSPFTEPPQSFGTEGLNILELWHLATQQATQEIPQRGRAGLLAIAKEPQTG